jgi:hypothetical protein
MSYSKQAANENRQIARRSETLLSQNKVLSEILDILQKEFPDIMRRRLNSRLDKVKRQLYGREVRKRQNSKN